ncbi:MAG: hypothetical protein KJP07_00420, partial [Desulfatitalea sp.]|nr:hypothetical protein [Desulfatitalea sp.]
RYTLDIDPETQHITFPAMLIQPVVENAIAQGLEHTLNGWEILIRTQKQGKILRVEIKDTGSGSSEKETIGTRLLNVKERVHSLFDGLGKIFFEHNPPSGLSVIFEVPCG